jgi:hypothetical protein
LFWLGTEDFILMQQDGIFENKVLMEKYERKEEVTGEQRE